MFEATVKSDNNDNTNDGNDKPGIIEDHKKCEPNFVGLFLRNVFISLFGKDDVPFQLSQYFQFKSEIVWSRVVIMVYLHLSLAYALYLVFTGQVMFKTILFAVLLVAFPAFSVTAGAHRLWTHRAYKATWQLRLILMLSNCMTFQIPLFDWIRDHRVHHKYSDTDADPHNITRGFFFSHMGWLMLRKHPDVIKKGKEIEMTDIEQDAIVMFQKKHYYWLMPIFAFLLPTVGAHYLFGETLTNSWYVAGILKNMYVLHVTWSVNSVAHYMGWKPYDKSIAASNNTYVGILAWGEGWHNYHHVFPWDYKTSELADYNLNWTTGVIDFFAKIGWAYDLKTVSEDLIRKRAQRTGDGIPYKYTRCIQPKSQLIEQLVNHHDFDENSIWGWDDKDMDTKDKENATIISREIHVE